MRFSVATGYAGTSSVEMLEGKSQHRALVGIGELQRLALDLTCDLVAQHCSAERRQLPAVIIEIRQDFKELCTPSFIRCGGSREGEEPTVITPIQFGHSRDPASFRVAVLLSPFTS